MSHVIMRQQRRHLHEMDFGAAKIVAYRHVGNATKESAIEADEHGR